MRARARRRRRGRCPRRVRCEWIVDHLVCGRPPTPASRLMPAGRTGGRAGTKAPRVAGGNIAASSSACRNSSPLRLGVGVGARRVADGEVDVGREACGSEDAVERVDSGHRSSCLVGRQRCAATSLLARPAPAAKAPPPAGTAQRPCGIHAVHGSRLVSDPIPTASLR